MSGLSGLFATRHDTGSQGNSVMYCCGKVGSQGSPHDCSDTASKGG